MREYGIGQSVPRVEDRRLLTGLGNYTDDRKVADQAHMAVVRSPHAAARVLSIDSDAAAAMPGVLAVLTGREADADGLGGLSCSVKRRQRDGQPMIEPPYPILAYDAVNMVGVAVAIVVAERLDQALDAAEMVDVDYEVLDAATDTGTALDPGIPQVWQDVANNESFYFTLGDQAAVEDAFAAATHVVDLEFTVTRVSANTMEPRGAIGFYDRSDERYTLYAGMQSPHRVRSELAGSILRIPEARLRIIAPDMEIGRAHV